jgi:hypothetical protein
VEVFARTFGHDGAAVGSLKRSRSSVDGHLHSDAAVETLQRVMLNPGPFNELSNVPEYIFVGEMCHLSSGKVSILRPIV